MAFPHYVLSNNNAGSFQPLFRLFHDLDSYSHQGGAAHPCGYQTNARRVPIPTWTPKFDFRETGEGYELHGELPGVSKDDLHIEFTEHQAMVIRGRNERHYTAGTSPHQDASSASTVAAATTTATASDDAPRSPPRSPRQATVEDEADAESGWEDVSDNKKTEKPTAEDQPEQQQQEQQVVEQPKVDSAKYWLNERSIGEFKRSFTFPLRIDQDGVTATFKDGVLSVFVPKAKKHEARRVQIG